MPTVDEVTRVGLSALRHAGVPVEHAQIQLSLLLDAELRGVASHGLLRLPRVIERVRNGICDPVTKGVGGWRGASFYQMDGCQGLGPVVALEALAAISDRAKEAGVAVAAVRNCNHLGMLAWYARRIAEQGQLLIALTVSEALVHPWGGSQAMLGTNPIAIGIPAEPQPFVFDMATSLVSMGKIHDYANRGDPLPHGWAVDAEGRPTVDARRAKHGAIAPFGGPKGYGLGLSFELLVFALTGCALGPDVAGTLDSIRECNKGDVFIVLKPMAGTAPLVGEFIKNLRASPSLDSTHPVRVPGDRSDSVYKCRQHSGVELTDDVWRTLLELAECPPQ